MLPQLANSTMSICLKITFPLTSVATVSKELPRVVENNNMSQLKHLPRQTVWHEDM